VTDEGLTPREIARAVARLEAADQALAAQITRLAAELLPVSLWDVQHKALVERVVRAEQDITAVRARLEKATEELERVQAGDIEKVRKEIRELRAEGTSRAELTWQKIIGLIGALAALALVVVTLLGQSKGIH
jgi:DNA repair exonuclease SbcCD ATPase subunit